MVPSFGFGGRKRIMMPGRLPSLLVRLETGMKSPSSRSPCSAAGHREAGAEAGRSGGAVQEDESQK